MGRKPLYTVEQVAEAIKASRGILTVASRRLGIDRRTIARYIERHPELRTVQVEATDRIVDLAEGKLYQAINEGNLTAIIFTLKCKGRARGWIDRQTVEHTGQIQTGPDLSNVTEDDLDALVAKALTGAGTDTPGSSNRPEGK